jgi:hypothetical protein
MQAARLLAASTTLSFDLSADHLPEIAEFMLRYKKLPMASPILVGDCRPTGIRSYSLYRSACCRRVSLPLAPASRVRQPRHRFASWSGCTPLGHTEHERFRRTATKEISCDKE